jgi:hypothetical protein
MATKFPKFSQALANDPATRRIWYGIATAHDLEAHDNVTEANLYNKIKVAPTIQPRALSITQGRAVGLAHYLLGGIGTTWAFFLARSISVG